MRWCSLFVVFVEDSPEFLGLDVGWVGDGDCASLGDDLSGSIRPFDLSETRAL